MRRFQALSFQIQLVTITRPTVISRSFIIQPGALTSPWALTLEAISLQAITISDIGNVGVAAEANTMRVGMQGIQTRTFIAGISGVAVAGSAVVANANGQLGIAASSERFKDEIKPMDKASEALFALKPVTFHYKKEIDPTRHTAVRTCGRGRRKSESCPGGARQRRKTLQRALRPGKRDVT